MKQSLSLKLILSSKKSNSRSLSENKLLNLTDEPIISWDEVSEIHRVRHGIYQRGGRLVSLLTDFGLINQCYPDAHGANEDTIIYTGAGRRGDQKMDSFNKAMFAAVETAHAVPLFNKLAVGRWQLTGFWRVTEGKYVYDKKQKRMIWRFTLQKATNY